jgi:O-antigen/teichoic acid export membrane protein
MFTKTDFALEYVHRKKDFRRRMWIFIAIWVALRIARSILMLTVGLLWLGAVPAMFLLWGSGLVCGLILYSYYIYRHSVRIDDIERERSNVAKLKRK